MYADTQRIWLSWTNTAATSASIVSAWNTADDTAITTKDFSYWFRWVSIQDESAAQRQVRQQQQAAATQRRRDMEAVVRAAGERAERLLERCLSTAQRATLTAQGWFEVTAPSGRRYRIRRGRVRNVVEIDVLGRQLRTYCCHPADTVPDADTMLAQKLMIEMRERDFLQLANVS